MREGFPKGIKSELNLEIGIRRKTLPSQLWLVFAYTYHLEMEPDTDLSDGVFACQEKCLPCCLCFVRPFLLSKLSNINKDRTTVIILL